MTKQHFLAVVDNIATVFAGGCTVHTDPPGYTLDHHVRRRDEVNRAAVRQAGQARSGR
jgi:hypothetical protein